MKEESVNVCDGKYDPTIDERLPHTVTLLTTPDGGKLYLIGTAHFSVESQNDVSKVTGICTFFFILLQHNYDFTNAFF